MCTDKFAFNQESLQPKYLRKPYTLEQTHALCCTHTLMSFVLHNNNAAR